MTLDHQDQKQIDRNIAHSMKRVGLSDHRQARSSCLVGPAITPWG